MKKKIICLFLISIILCVGVFSSASTEKAFSVGTNYGLFDINTSGDARQAASYYGSAGYSSSYSVEPTYQIMRGKFSDGTNYRMSSAILFFSGHANYSNMNFNYNGKGGDYMTGVYYGTSFDSTSGYKYAGLKSFNLRNTKLITFAGCLTASNTTNLPSVAVSEGAKTAIGWTEKVGEMSHSSWLGYYNEYLNKGYTVQQAINYANSFAYWDSNVKKYKLYGDSSLKITSTVSTNSAESDSRIVSVENSLYTDKEIEKEIKKLNNKFDLNKYKKVESVVDGKRTIDYIYIAGDFISDSGYTVFIDEEKKVTIYDNNYQVERFEEDVLKTTVSEEKIKKAQNNAIEKIKTKVKGNDKITIANTNKVFDSKTGEKYIYITIEHTLEGTNAVYVHEYLEKIE